MISEELLQSFIAEASDLLDDVEPSLVEYSRLDDAEERMEIVNRVFRHFHSIKGSAGFVGLHDIARLTHEAETLLEQFRKAPDKVIPQQNIVLLCRTVDLLRAIFENSGRNENEDGEPLGIDSLISEISQATQSAKTSPIGGGFSALSLSADLGLDDPAPAPANKPPSPAEPEGGTPAPSGDGPSAKKEESKSQDTGWFVRRNGKTESTKKGTGKKGDTPPPSPMAATRRLSSDTARIIHSKKMTRQSKLNTAEFAERYVSEANELLEQIEQALLHAEQNPESSNDSIQEALRCLHSFKGNSGFMNLTDLERLSHRMESEVENNIGRALGLDSQTFDALLQMIDVLRQGVLDYSYGGTGAIPEADAYIAMLDEYSYKPNTKVKTSAAPEKETEKTAAPPEVAAAIQSRPPDPITEDAPTPNRPDPSDNDESAAPRPSAETSEKTDKEPDNAQPAVTPYQERILAEANLPAYSNLLETVLEPGANTPEPNASRRDKQVRKRDTTTLEFKADQKEDASKNDNGRKNNDTTRLVLRGNNSQQEDLRSAPRTDSINIMAPPPIPPIEQTVVAPAPESERERQQSDTRRIKNEERPRPRPTNKDTETGQKRRTADQLSSRNDIRVDLRKLDAMLDLVGELVIAEAMVTRHPVVWDADNESLERAVHQLRRVASSLQDMATSVRMIPLAPTFRRMTRLVYDLSVKAGKQVDLILLGEETEVDRTVIERISDPLVHIIRNAIDHGIETPAERSAVGKPETGRLTIEGHHEGGEVWIIITDDGRGLDRDAILAKAISRGLVTGDGSDLTDNQIFHFIFEPGFTTAVKVTDISGRGFGMDVVKKNIEKLSGKIDIRTRPGEGTAVVMRIPLTLAIIEGMLVSSGGTRYIIPLLSIRESLRPDISQIFYTPDGQAVVKLRDELIPVVKLDETFDRVKSERNLMDGILMIVEGEEGEVIALFADELLGQQETVIKGLSGWLKKSRGVSGCTILGDGEVGLILDIGAIVRLARQKSSA